jgi:hypothetical protein
MSKKASKQPKSGPGIKTRNQRQNRDELTSACVSLLVGEFHCDASHLKRRIFDELFERKIMDVNQHGQMVEVA